MYKRTNSHGTSPFLSSYTDYLPLSFASPATTSAYTWYSFCTHARLHRLYQHSRRESRRVWRNPTGEWWPGLWRGWDLGGEFRSRGWGYRGIRYRCLRSPLRGLLPLGRSSRSGRFRCLRSDFAVVRGLRDAIGLEHLDLERDHLK